MFLEVYYYELRAYIYQARNLLSMDNDSFSGRKMKFQLKDKSLSVVDIDPYAQIAFVNQSQRTEVIQKTLCPIWDQVYSFCFVFFSRKIESILILDINLSEY